MLDSPRVLPAMIKILVDYELTQTEDSCSQTNPPSATPRVCEGNAAFLENLPVKNAGFRRIRLYGQTQCIHRSLDRSPDQRFFVALPQKDAQTCFQDVIDTVYAMIYMYTFMYICIYLHT